MRVRTYFFQQDFLTVVVMFGGFKIQYWQNWHESDICCLFFFIKQINYPYVYIRDKYCTNCEPVSRQAYEHVFSSSLYVEMCRIETDTEEKRQWLSNSCRSIVKIQTAWSAVNTNKFQKGIAIKTLVFSHSAQNNMNTVTFNMYLQKWWIKENQNPSEDAKMRITSCVIFAFQMLILFKDCTVCDLL